MLSSRIDFCSRVVCCALYRGWAVAVCVAAVCSAAGWISKFDNVSDYIRDVLHLLPIHQHVDCSNATWALRRHFDMDQIT